MRFLLVLLVWGIIIGGVYLYTVKRDSRTVAAVPVAEAVSLDAKHFSLEITPTFNLEKDPFALVLDDQQTLLEVRINGKNLQVDTQQAQAGQVMQIEHLANLVHGPNEIFIQAAPPTAASASASEYGVRIKVMEDSLPIAETTLWSNAGSLVSGSLHFTITTTEDTDEH
ncbi:hypothetical protein [Desulfogranum japonicum]|uniref:hypothetical protein n=1 Tax=Desulfogranum japonicum TaxID=231447 RepID=UPI0003F62BBC|nr:hypothetical protein [Desulfogranum japonicum]